MTSEYISVEGARQHNLKNISIKIPLNRITVVTGVSGSGKSSLVFDTIYAEGQRRYVETFSAYTRQFLERMDRPIVDRVDGIPPAIAVDQTNPVRTSRSTVGTMTELNDHLKLLFARSARLFCGNCNRPVVRDSPDSAWKALCRDVGRQSRARLRITFGVPIPDGFDHEEIESLLVRQGYQRFTLLENRSFEVVQDRVRMTGGNRARIIDDIETAFRIGNGKVSVSTVDDDGATVEEYRFSTDLHCPDCDIHFRDPTPNLFSFNSPVGACATCRGFGRTIGIDYDLVIPDPNLSLRDGAVKPWRSGRHAECQADLLSFGAAAGMSLDVPWADLDERTRRWAIQGEGDWEDGKWYGIERFFGWLESRSYRMHIRVFLSRYRSYDLCPECLGARLKHQALLWRVGEDNGLSIRQLMTMPIGESLLFCKALRCKEIDDPTELVLDEIVSRLEFLVEVGLEYLTLDRQSRTLSGGEVQRINLTTALSTSLVNTLFVLDEPSIGLHSRDIRRLIGVLRRLRDAGNTLLVVEHDPELIQAADTIIDMGPDPGENGGQIVFQGGLKSFRRSRKSITAAYLRGDRRVNAASAREPRGPNGSSDGASLTIHDAQEHNLTGFDVAIPLGKLVCLTGVSGSGKSTLMDDILYKGLSRRLGESGDRPGLHGEMTGWDGFAKTVLVDQSPIGKTTRSNPVSYVGAFDSIRKLFAQSPMAKERNYTAGSFSYNSEKGKCPSCSGSGYERVEMQFLSDVYIRCDDCGGTRYRPDILEVKILPRRTGNGDKTGPFSIADVLAMTVSEAARCFCENSDINRRLAPLLSVGLGYVTLGQPVPTLSGGESQRLKLAGHLIGGSDSSSEAVLFLFDEPTTGLHFADIELLVGAFRTLIDAGHTVVVIEHNLDVISAADWIIDLGPEGGANGGRIVDQGTVEKLIGNDKSHTGRALAAYGQEDGILLAAENKARYRPSTDKHIVVRNAREHNLNNLSVKIPRDKLTVITGVSGSGKSTLAFDILFAEGQRRYLESLNAYARQFVQPASRPDVDAILGVPPTVAIEQRTSRGGRKSTVGTVSEVYHFIRLLFVRIGRQFCPTCRVEIEAKSAEAVVAEIMRENRGGSVDLLAPLVVSRKGYYTDLAKWAAKKGYENLRVDGEYVPTKDWPRLDRYKEHSIELPVATIAVSPAAIEDLGVAVDQTLGLGVGSVIVAHQGKADVYYSSKRSCPGCGRGFPELDPRLFSYNSSLGWCPECEGTGLGDGDHSVPCPECDGERLKETARAVRFHGVTIGGLTSMSVSKLRVWFEALSLDGREAEIASGITSELLARLSFLEEVGVGYLSLDRGVPTLSGGEAQRMRLAGQLGSNLRGACYILDEPTIGLHPRDNRKLLDALATLRDKGNTVIVVEHDEETIRDADYLIDLGPGGGTRGGELVAHGTVSQVLRNPKSVTGHFLKHPLSHSVQDSTQRNPLERDMLTVAGANKHNLKDLHVGFPLNAMVCVTGVSGSGKSTLVQEELFARTERMLAQTHTAGESGVSGWEQLSRIMEVDQTPIGRTPRSCPATYTGIWNSVRTLYAETPEARLRGFAPSRFSFNVEGGRCEECSGQGLKRIEMSFLPDVHVECEACRGRRFNEETLNVLFRGKSIADVLSMSVDEAVPFFAFHPKIHNTIRLLQDIGLGYVTLGQQSPTLSGGEAQRTKLVSELSRTKLYTPSDGKHTLYILDEPTIGLHMADVERLTTVLKRLVAAGNTVIVIEHNLDVIAESDWIIDLGPEGGDEGGELVVSGPPDVIRSSSGYTGRFLDDFLKARQER
jgi:excinuclease ABC subunit A